MQGLKQTIYNFTKLQHNCINIPKIHIEKKALHNGTGNTGCLCVQEGNEIKSTSKWTKDLNDTAETLGVPEENIVHFKKGINMVFLNRTLVTEEGQQFRTAS